jgi:uncharacterized pyridoxamine 5'-phosphate oxidase family protein
VGKFAYYLEDKTGKLSIEDIQKEEYQRQFRANNENILNFGMNENYYWIRIEASAYLNDRNDNFLLQTMHVLENVSFFKKDSTGNWREYAGGNIKKSSKQRNLLH